MKLSFRDAFVAMRLTVTGTHQCEFSGLPATGKKVLFTAMDIHRIDNGRIAETWHAEDFTKMVAQLKS
jgi:predicted ester cyclase